jgi:hypothetical protein
MTLKFDSKAKLYLGPITTEVDGYKPTPYSDFVVHLKVVDLEPLTFSDSIYTISHIPSGKSIGAMIPSDVSRTLSSLLLLARYLEAGAHKEVKLLKRMKFSAKPNEEEKEAIIKIAEVAKNFKRGN